jgi:hypothetical protein
MTTDAELVALVCQAIEVLEDRHPEHLFPEQHLDCEVCQVILRAQVWLATRPPQ